MNGLIADFCALADQLGWTTSITYDPGEPIDATTFGSFILSDGTWSVLMQHPDGRMFREYLDASNFAGRLAAITRSIL